MFHIGIIGCGKIAQVRHIPEYADNPDAQLTAFYDLNAARAQELAERYGGKAYDSVEALLADPNVDAVSVCSACCWANARAFWLRISACRRSSRRSA